jgi:hypothetical protein
MDSEFTGLHQKTSLISIGLIAENNRTFYAEFNDYDKTQIDEWLKINIIDNLKFNKLKVKLQSVESKRKDIAIKNSKSEIKQNLITWFNTFEEPLEIWSDCLAYDWVLFCELFDGALNLPKNIYYIPFDLCTLLKIRGEDPDIDRIKFSDIKTKPRKHNALFDALIIKLCVEKLLNRF